jgi:hypothetical protein
MKRLSSEAFERARQFIRTQAGVLDAEVVDYRFEDSPAEGVLALLVSYQNRDDVFGQALEPELRTPSSSALAPGIGLRLLVELRCD